MGCHVPWYSRPLPCSPRCKESRTGGQLSGEGNKPEVFPPRFQPPFCSSCLWNTRVFGPEVLAFIKELGRRIRTETGEPCSLQFLLQGLRWLSSGATRLQCGVPLPRQTIFLFDYLQSFLVVQCSRHCSISVLVISKILFMTCMLLGFFSQ